MKSFDTIFEEEKQKEELKHKEFLKYRGQSIELLEFPSMAPLRPRFVNEITLKDKDVYEFIEKIRHNTVLAFTPITGLINKLKKLDKTIKKDTLSDKEVTLFKAYMKQFNDDVKTDNTHPLTVYCAKMIIDKLITCLRQ